jgi:hypothetical protein
MLWIHASPVRSPGTFEIVSRTIESREGLESVYLRFVAGPIHTQRHIAAVTGQARQRRQEGGNIRK